MNNRRCDIEGDLVRVNCLGFNINANSANASQVGDICYNGNNGGFGWIGPAIKGNGGWAKLGWS